MGTIRREVRDNYLSRFPHEERMLTPFLSGFFVTWARERVEYNTSLKVFFLSPEDHFKESYGFDNELMLVYAPYQRMEPRTLQAIEQIFSQSPAKGRVETLNYFLVSDADNVREWLDDYTSSRQESRIIVSFTKDELEESRGDPWYIRNKLNEQFFGRDLFNYSLPLVEDTYFFGRQQLVMEYIDAVKRKENKAIFGLRKTGKTSFLFKIRRLIEGERFSLVIYIDCKLPDVRKSHWYELLGDIAEQIATKLDIENDYVFDDRKASRSFLELIKKAREIDKQICIMFDEIEFISFVAKIDKHWHEEFLDFWQTMWSCQSQVKNFSFIISGVNPSVVEINTVSGVQNPLFGIVTHKYLTGFSSEEVRIMIKRLGKRMGIRFTHEAIDDVHEWYGGHPLLTRLCCSWLNTIISQSEQKPISISREIFKNTKDRCDSELVFYCDHVVSELKEFYPDEYTMLELLSSNQMVDFIDLAEGETYIKHLKNYGILKEENQEYLPMIPVVCKYVGTELARREKRQLVFKIIETKHRESWLKRRVEEIKSDIRMLERIISNLNGTILFGVNSFPEADRFSNVTVAENIDSFTAFINVCYRCFVESIDIYGRSINKQKYFWEEVKTTYPNLFHVLHKIRVYRHERDHLQLNNNVSEQLITFLDNDLEGKNPSQVEDFYFVLQQRILDSFLYELQIVINKLS
ncbi:hypothetical protein [Maridesulfovibrio sp.]|uniref:hypothetical protein n=1 Tax=Maridesulfovibrio sp. TaxID=2795000 RepID=UPI002A18A475|nr:hypothetical protein [Maridesulfovibrio sp.]